MIQRVQRQVIHLPSHIEQLATQWLSNSKNKAQLRQDYLKLMHNNTQPLEFIEYKEREVQAYIAGYFPSIYAQNISVLSELKKYNFSYASVLDVGCGVGTSLMALHELGIRLKMTGFDSSEDMLEKCKHFGAQQNLQITTTTSLPKEPQDLIICSHFLSNIQPSLRVPLLNELWRLTNKTLLLIDRGNPDMFATLAEFRIKAKKNGSVVAPCTHDGFCPLLLNMKMDKEKVSNWCHFAQRTQRPAFTKLTKHSKHDCEDTKYTYLIINKETFKRQDVGRITNAPLQRGGHVLLDLCTEDQWSRVTIPKSMGKEIYTKARKSRWGDSWNHGYKSAMRALPFENTNKSVVK